jgi:hypothetical protein
MKTTLGHIILMMVLLSACVTNDFKVVDALRVGMTQDEARSTIASFGFQREEALSRPESGWPVSEKGFTNLPGRAHRIENEQKKRVAITEYYPVHHGLLGFGQLFLFYGTDGRLMKFYRYQIN